MDVKQVVSQMTLEEKAGLLSGLDFWHTKPVKRLGVESCMPYASSPGTVIMP